jgi:hypothetical protein
MGPLKAATIALAVGLVQGEVRACDSYADEASLAAVLARAVAEARANGGLEAQASQRLLPAEPERQPAATSAAGGGELGVDQRRTAAPPAPASSSL